MPKPRYAIMDERAYQDVDQALIMAVQSNQETLADLQHERDQSWPGYPIVDITTWEVLAESRAHLGRATAVAAP